MNGSSRTKGCFLCTLMVAMVLLGVFLGKTFDCSGVKPVSFWYRLQVVNGTSENCLSLSLIQLTDVMERGTNIKYQERLIAKGKRVLFQLSGECDSESTLFLLTGVPTDGKGVPREIPATHVLLKFLTFRDFRGKILNEFPTKEFVVSDSDLVPAESIKFWGHDYVDHSRAQSLREN